MFNTNKIIIVRYPVGHGGKFLINCLGLGYNSVLQDIKLAKLQLAGNLSPDDKFNLLMQRLADTKNNWSDLDLGCMQYFGVNDDYYKTSVTHTVKDFYQDVQEVVSRDWYSFIVSHETSDYTNKKIVWPNHRCISFRSSSAEFLSTYRPNKGVFEYWNTVRAESWPKECPLTKEEIFQLPSHIVDELVGVFGGKIFNFVPEESHSPQSEESELVWDTAWYLTESATVDNVGHLYNQLGITEFDPDLIAKYRSAWLNVLLKIQ